MAQTTLKTQKSPGGSRQNSNSPRHLTPVVSRVSNRPRGQHPVVGYSIIALALVALCSIHAWVEPIATPLVGLVLLLAVLVGLGLWLTRSLFQLKRELFV